MGGVGSESSGAHLFEVVPVPNKKLEGIEAADISDDPWGLKKRGGFLAIGSWVASGGGAKVGSD